MRGVVRTSDPVNSIFTEDTSALFRPVVEAEDLRSVTQRKTVYFLKTPNCSHPLFKSHGASIGEFPSPSARVPVTHSWPTAPETFLSVKPYVATSETVQGL